jgi:hypothetical protein
MIKPKFKTTVPGESLQVALESLKKLLWNLSWRCDEGTWLLFAGDRLLFESNTEDAIWAFIYGLSLAYSALPEPLLHDFEAYSESIRDGSNVEFLKKKGWRLSKC